ncbi:MAG: aminotransferase class IV [Candidatus Omnitrophota bacterium]
MLYVCINNRKVVQTKAKVPFNCPGFLYGQLLFETMRAYNGRVFLLKKHLQRLLAALPVVGFAPNLQEEKLAQAVISALSASKFKDARVRLSVWQEEGRSGFGAVVSKYEAYSSAKYNRGFRAIVSRLRQNEFSPLSRVKSGNYLLHLLALKAAQKKKCDEAILLNTKGRLCEGSRSNIFLVQRGKLFTPDLSQGCLKGITRQTVLKLAKKNKIEIKEGAMPLSALFNCDEAFLTNSLIEIMPLVKVDNRLIGKGAPGIITKLLAGEYRELVKRDTA